MKRSNSGGRRPSGGRPASKGKFSSDKRSSGPKRKSTGRGPAKDSERPKKYGDGTRDSSDKKSEFRPSRGAGSKYSKGKPFVHRDDRGPGKSDDSVRGEFKSSERSGSDRPSRERSFKRDDKPAFDRRDTGRDRGEFKSRERGPARGALSDSRKGDGDKKDFKPRPRSSSADDKSRDRRERPTGERSFRRDEKPAFDKRDSGRDRPTGDRSFNREDKPAFRKRDAGRDSGEFKSRERGPARDALSDSRKGDGDKKELRPRTRTFSADDKRRSTRSEKPPGERSYDRDDKPSFDRKDADSVRGEFKSRERTSTPSDGERKEYRRSSGDRDSTRAPRNKDSTDRPWNRKESHSFYGDKMKSKKAHLPKVDDGSTRLNKYIANAGICSRREADELITAGVISVNGEVITELGYKVQPGDLIKYNNETLKTERLVYILLNKPKDFITTTDDPEERKTVMSLIAKAGKERVYPVGRLDRNTTGLLLFTNDGDLAKRLTHPSSETHKVYQVELDKSLKAADMESIRSGITLADGFIKVDEIVYTTPDKDVVGVELHSGRNRIVRRIFEHLGYEVKKLDRVIFAGLTKKDLPRGRWRFLTEMEIAGLKMARKSRTVDN